MERMIEIDMKRAEGLRKAFKVSRMTVWRALHYRSDGPSARRIRAAALRTGGMAVVVAPECETVLDRDGWLRQRFRNGAVLELHKDTGEARVTKEGTAVREYGRITLEELSGVQAEAAGL